MPAHRKWALILGASSGFGAATARAFAKKGVHIIGVHLDRKATMYLVDELTQEIEGAGVQAWFINRNAANPDDIEAILDQVHERFARDSDDTIVAIMHSLAFGSLMPFITPDMTGTLKPKQISMTLEVMANSLVYWVQGVIRRSMMESGGRVFAMTSSGGRRIIPKYGAVSAAKAALESHVRQLGYELGPLGITANAICGGVTDTYALRKIPGNRKLRQDAIERNPHHRMGTPDEVAQVIVGMCDPAFAWVNGSVVYADGGEDAVATGTPIAELREMGFEIPDLESE